MKNRSEAISHFQTFCNEIKNQFGISVHTLRSDKVKEFLTLSFMHFMFDTGISHQTSCPYTSQQNMVIERKNHHLLEIHKLC